MLQWMKRIQVIGPKEDLNRVVDLLYHEGTVHLENVPDTIAKEEIELTRVKVERANEITDVLGKLDGIFATLPKINGDTGIQHQILENLRDKNYTQIIDRSKEVIRELESKTRALASRKSELGLTITQLSRYAKVVDFLMPVEGQIPKLEWFEVAVLLIQKEYADVVELVRQEMEKITNDRFELESKSLDDETLGATLIFHKKYSEAVHSFIYSVNVTEVRLPREYMGKPFYEMIAMIEQSKVNAGDEKKRIDDQLLTLSTRWYQELAVLKKLLEDQNEELSVYANFGLSEFTFVIMGWIPNKFLKRMKNAVEQAFSGRVVVHVLPVTEKDMEKAPTFYDNPSWVKPFEFIMGLVTPPSYREFDPSPILATFFPVFFGIMVGDIGYGIVIHLFSLGVRKKFRDTAVAQNLANILLLSSVPTIIFGFMFGEFFGNVGEHFGFLHPMHFLGITWNRVDAMIPMLILAIIIGVIHVVLGLIIGLRNSLIMKSRKHASEKLGMLLMISGLITIIATMANVIPVEGMYAAIVLVVVALPLLLYGAGVFGTMEVMSTIGNILSYARLMAIGMASVILAIVANELGWTLEIVLIGVIIAVSLHALNIVLAMFSPSIHSVRLHLVEFFSKFYKGGGIPYKPFRKGDVKGT